LLAESRKLILCKPVRLFLPFNLSWRMCEAQTEAAIAAGCGLKKETPVNSFKARIRKAR
jgi:hypothetical protein